MVENTYPLNEKTVYVNKNKVTLRELPVKYIIAIEKKNVTESVIDTCLEGSDTTREIVESLGNSQVEAMYRDIMVLSYGKDWEKRAETSNSKKK